MIPSEWTEGMSLIEKLVVLLAAHASKGELKRLRAFFIEYRGERP